MEKGLISVIVPIFNVEKYLERCLDSILANTYRNLEVICINDGSTDHCLEILEKYKRSDERVLIINQENQGISSARNAGLAVAKGEYISFIDSDDWVHREFFRYLYETAERYNADITDCQFVRTNDCTVLNNECENKYKEITLAEFFGNHQIRSFVWNKLYKHSIVEGRVFNESLKIEDAAFLIDLISDQITVKTAMTQAALYAYYSRDGSFITNFHEDDIMSLSEYILERSESIKDETVKEIVIKDALKRVLSTRLIYRVKKMNPKVEYANHLLMLGIKNLSTEKHKYRVMYLLPWFYQMMIISRDPSMKKYIDDLKKGRKG